MKFHSLFLTALTALSLALGGCNNDDTIVSPDGDADGPKITFTIGVVSCDGATDSSRAGDGGYYDTGLEGEKTVSNATIIIYDRPLNAPKGTGKIVKTIYVESLGSFTASTKEEDATYFDPVASYYPQSDVVNKIKIGTVKLSNYYPQTITLDEKDVALEYGKTYYATAICNFGDMKNELQGKDLDVLRDFIYEGPLYKSEIPANGALYTNLSTSKGSEGIRAYSEFRMAGVNETSFFWERKTTGAVKLGDFMVQRLAARVDVMFGGKESDFKNQAPGPTSYYYFEGTESHTNPIELAVYTMTDGELTIAEDKIFYLDDLQVINNVYPGEEYKEEYKNNQRTCMYLIERSSKNAQSANVQPVYFDNEGWQKSGSNPHFSATKYVYSPSSRNFRSQYDSFHTVAGYNNLNFLIKAGVIYNDTGVDYYENQRNGSVVVGYLGENTNSVDHFIKIRVVGRTNAPTSAIFNPETKNSVKSRDGENTGGDEFKTVVGEITLTHSQNTAMLMRNAVVRNTIYRVRIKVVSRDNKIFFEYYYVTPDGKSQTVLDTEGSFLSNVGELTSGSYTPNE